jgi:NAD(P)-dependent dehydrogenase (short-subunit alcohol dehydrogenase family)
MTRIAVVLGASTGTGAACARQLSGSHVVVGFHRGMHPKEAAQLEHETSVRLQVSDVGSDSACVRGGVEAVNDYLRSNYGRGQVSTLVHALSGASVGRLLDTPWEKVAPTFSRMAHSFLWWAQELHARELLAPGATLIALSNPVAENYLRNAGVIGAAKAALEAYVKALAVELGPFGHRVLCIRFGAVITPALEKVVPGAAERLQELHEHISPYGVVQTTEEIAQFIALLADSYGARGLNGAVIDFTNGAHLKLMDFAFNSLAP